MCRTRNKAEADRKRHRRSHRRRYINRSQESGIRTNVADTPQRGHDERRPADTFLPARLDPLHVSVDDVAMSSFDLIIVGGGPAGYTGAIRAAQLGLNTAIIDNREVLGGTCLDIGCIPSKALLLSSDHFHFAQHQAARHGLKFEKVSIDLAQMMSRKQGVVRQLTQGLEFLMKKTRSPDSLESDKSSLPEKLF